jgi:adenylosuccinate lyase
MTAIWTPENRFHIWYLIEAHACDAQADLGVIPKSAAKTVWDKGNLPYTPERVARIDAIEAEVKHDVIAFLTELAQHIGEDSRFVHQGMTSSDVLDTCLAVQLTQAADILLDDIDKLLAALKRRALETKDMVCMGRSHGIHAEPVTIGLKFAGFHAEFQRARTRLLAARADVATCAISGAVGTFANIDPAVEGARRRKTRPRRRAPVHPGDPARPPRAVLRHLGVIASSVERVATEIRHLQRTEVREAEEYFAPGQKGSSAMPHKRNPVLTENLCGLARMVRGFALPAMENVALWHERDISHSSVERMIGPDATVTLDFALARLTGVIDKLVIYPDAVDKNLNQLGGLIFSQRVLLALTQAGVSREDSYRIVQRNAMRVWAGEGRFLDFLKADADVAARLDEKTLEGIFDMAYHTKHVDTIFARVFA